LIGSSIKIGLSAGLLIILGLGLTLYKAIELDVPLVPGEFREVWTIESKATFLPTGGALDVRLKLPDGVAGWAVLEEHFASSGFGFSVLEEGEARHARWTRNELDRLTTLYYKIQAYRAQRAALPLLEPEPVRKPLFEQDQLVALERLVVQLRERSSDVGSFVGLLIEEFRRELPDQDAQFLLGTYEEGTTRVMLDVLAWADIPVRTLRGIVLEDGRRRQTLSTLFEVYDGSEWLVFNPKTAERGLPKNFFIWQRGTEPVLSVSGGRDSSLEFALVSNSLPARTVVGMEQRAGQFALLDFSIYTLPVEQQGVFKGLLLIPVAALVVVIMRVLVGVSTSGTFMPILIALAFIQTTLLLGLVIFRALVGVGLWIRSWLSHMNLLLVARIAAVVIVVILLMAALAVLSYKLGLDQVLTVTFFPTVILAWTIERMSILWEEEGGHEVLVQGGGSLLVAVLAYLAMSNRLVAHLTFNFPELMLSLLGVILLLGKYKGYRLSELYRFRDLAGRQ
jgi:hypothetical protein